MMLLAVDTSTRFVGIALYDGVQVLSEAVWRSQYYHTVELAPGVDNILRQSGVEISQLKVLAVALGPGSFTGLRIGLALAKGIAFVNRLPIVGVPTLDILAFAQPLRKETMAAVLYAGRGRLAVGWYRSEAGAWVSRGAIEVMALQELSQRIHEPTLLCGELGAEDQHYFIKQNAHAILAAPAQSLRRPSYLAELGWQRFLNGDFEDPATLAPIYMPSKNFIPG